MTVLAAWGGLYVHWKKALDLTPFTTLELWVQPTAQDQNFVVAFTDVNGRQIGVPVALGTLALLVQRIYVSTVVCSNIGSTFSS